MTKKQRIRVPQMSEIMLEYYASRTPEQNEARRQAIIAGWARRREMLAAQKAEAVAVPPPAPLPAPSPPASDPYDSYGSEPSPFFTPFSRRNV